ncbi:MAG: thioredoxin [Halobacteriales archaeon]
MTDDELDALRERRREELERQLSVPASLGAPIEVDGPDHFAEVVRTHDVVLVDFYADWCGPCKMLEPTVEAIAAETDATVAEVDIDVHQSLAAQHRVRGVPTLVLYADGEPVEHLVGVQDRATLESLIDRHLA